ncbi:MAG: hypothetical protein KC477_09910 [Oceanospirillaceae bacterium]|nr:hypothetical protein [Oceanospirillaceae bacterium]
MTKLIYITDPLCGWCWASAPVIATANRTATDLGIPFELLHRALFTGDMVRWMSRSFSDYVTEADQRITAASGQRFSDAYRDKLLYKPDLIFDSWPTAIAMQVIKALKPNQEYAFFCQLQRLRFNEGKIITDSSVLTEAAILVGIKAIDFHNAFTYSPSVDDAAKRDQWEAISLQNQVLSQGVPCLLLERDGSLVRLPLESWLADPEGFAQLLQQQLITSP